MQPHAQLLMFLPAHFRTINILSKQLAQLLFESGLAAKIEVELASSAHVSPKQRQQKRAENAVLPVGKKGKLTIKSKSFVPSLFSSSSWYHSVIKHSGVDSTTSLSMGSWIGEPRPLIM